MKTKLFAIITVVLVFALSLFASQTTVTGILTDDMCTRKHMMPGKANGDCVRACIKHGAKYVVVSERKVLALKGSQQDFEQLAGKKVTLTGELTGGTLSVTKIETASATQSQ